MFDSDKQVRIKEYERYQFPSKYSNKRKQLVNELREMGKWDEVNQLDTNALNKIILQKEWDDYILSVLDEYVSLETSKRFYLGSIKK